MHLKTNTIANIILLSRPLSNNLYMKGHGSTVNSVTFPILYAMYSSSALVDSVGTVATCTYTQRRKAGVNLFNPFSHSSPAQSRVTAANQLYNHHIDSMALSAYRRSDTNNDILLFARFMTLPVLVRLITFTYK